MNTRELNAAWLLSVAGVAIALLVIHQQKLNLDLRTIRTERQNAASNHGFGSPPVPFRPDHPKQIAGTYYRGNCERNPLLFNNGNYLTAIFRINLCDADHKVLELEAPFPASGAWVRFELERAAGTTPMLFSPEMMASVFLGENSADAGMPMYFENPTRLEAVEKDRRWVAYVPLAPSKRPGKFEGVIYLGTGRADMKSGVYRGEPQYAIKYDLHVVDGKLAADSDLWMGSFGNPAVSNPEPPGRIPFREWFDYRPIPQIEGENSQDPKLLGVQEYVDKGLIKQPPPEPESEK